MGLTEAHLRVRSWLEAEEGQGLVEYGLIIALVAVAIIGAPTALRGNIATVFGNIGTGMTT